MDTYIAQAKYLRVLSGSLVFTLLFGIIPSPLLVLASAVEPVGTLTTVVEVIGGAAVPSDFQIVVNSGTSTEQVFLGSASGTPLSISGGALYTVDVAHVPGYNTTESAGCFGMLTDGGSSVCTVTNIFSALAGANLHVVTRVLNTQGGTNIPGDFIVNISGGNASPAFFRGTTDGKEVSLTPGVNYAVQVNPGSRYQATLSPACSGISAEGETLACNITFNDLALFPEGVDSTNLLTNTQLEVADSGDATRPQGWAKGFDWGTNIATYTYPVAVGSSSDISSGNAMSVSYAAYTGPVLTGGDAKWCHTSATPVIPGHRYQYQDAYRADTATYLVAEFFDASHAHVSNAGFFPVPITAADSWNIASASFIAPPGAAFMMVYHQLNSTGTLTLDNISLREVALASKFTQGFVSLSFDDGYNDHFSNAKTVLDAAGVSGTFFIVSHNSGFGVANPALEFADGANLSKPLGWVASSDASTTYTYPVSGRTGSAVRVSASDAAPDGGWSIDPVSIFANQNFQLSHYYKSDATSAVYVQVKKTDQSISYMQSDGGLVSSKVAYATLPPATDWTLYSSPGFWIPPESVEVSMRYSLAASGTLDIDDVNMGAYLDFMTPSNLLSLQQAQHEIGGHTQTHADLTTLSLAQAQQEVNGSRQDLLSGGMTPVQSFAYPLGGNNEEIQNLVQSAGYTSGRGTVEGYNGKNANRYDLRSKMVMTDTPMSEIQHLINGAVADHTWLILTFHQILPVGGTAYTTTPERLASIVDYLTKNTISIATVADGAALMDGGGTVVDSTAPVIAPHADIEAVATSSSGVFVTYALPSVSDNVDVGIIAACTPLSSTLFALGTTTVTCTAQDLAGNAAIPASFFVHVSLFADPAITTPTTTPATTTPPQGNSGGGGGGGSIGGSASSPYWACTASTALNYNKLATHNYGCVFRDPPHATTTDTGVNGGVSTTTTSGTTTDSSASIGEVLGTTTPPAYRFQHALRKGSRGAEVVELQRRLRDSGHFNGPLTGYFGNLTFAAVKKYQQTHQFEAVGIVGPKTRAALNAMGDSWTIASTSSGVVLVRK